MRTMAIVAILLLLPGAVFAEYLGYRSCNRVTGNCSYYSAPNSAADAAVGLEGFRMFGQALSHMGAQRARQQAFEMEMRRRDAEIERLRAETRLANERLRQLQSNPRANWGMDQ